MSNDLHTDSPDGQSEALERVAGCAASGDLVGLLQGLFDARILDGLTRRLQARYPAQGLDIDNLVGEAMLALCQAIEDGTSVENVVAYLRGVTDNMARDEMARRIQEAPVEADVLDGRSEGVPPRPISWSFWEALAIVRSLAAELTHTGMRSVTLCVLAALEAGHDLHLTDVARDLGLSAANVRQLKKRGLDQIARLARERGYARGPDPPVEAEGVNSG